MPAAIAIPSLISAGTSIVGGVMGSKASKKAAQQQVQSADRGLELLGGIHQQQQQQQSPYMQLGQGALSNLGMMVGRPMTAPAVNPAPSPTSQMPWQQQPQQVSTLPMSSLMSWLGMAGAQGGGMVRMRAPDGSTQMVPKAQVAHYQQLGARQE